MRCHRRCTGFVNARLRRTDHLFQERFASAVMDEAHLMTALRHVRLDPVRARLVARAQDWPGSSVRAHLGLSKDGVTAVAPGAVRVERFADLIEGAAEDSAFGALRRGESIGRPLADEAFVQTLETRLDRQLRPRMRGRKKLAIG